MGLFMKEFFPVLHTAALFSGISDDELAAKLDQFRADTAAAIAKKDAAIAAEAAAM